MDVQKSPISLLQEYLAKNRSSRPDYTITGGGTNFICHVKAMNKQAVGHGLSKQEAKTEAAWNLLKDLFGVVRPTAASTKETGFFENYIGELESICAIHRIGPPVYIQMITGEARFAFKCLLKGKVHIGYGLTKQAARHAAAKGIVELFSRDRVPNNAINIADMPVKKFDEELLTEQLIQKLDQLTATRIKRIPLKQSEGITSYHMFFANDKSSCALGLCPLLPSQIELLENPEKTLKMILAEYRYKAEVVKMVDRLYKSEHKCVIAHKISCLCSLRCTCPTFVFTGIGDSKMGASKDAVMSALKFFSNMAI